MHSVDTTQMSLPLFDRDHAVAFQPRPPRRRTCLNGKLVYSDGTTLPDGAFTLDCTIRDISEGGAKIILARRQLLPSDLYLIVVKLCIAYWAKVVWLNYPARGLKFSKAYAMSEPLPDELKFLRALWGDLFARPGHVEWL
jgi:hypothetical protein